MRFINSHYTEVAFEDGTEFDVYVPAILDTFRNKMLDKREFMEYVNDHLNQDGTLPGENPTDLVLAMLKAAHVSNPQEVAERVAQLATPTEFEKTFRKTMTFIANIDEAAEMTLELLEAEHGA